MSWLALAAIIIISGYIIGRETLAVQAGLRTGEDHLLLFRRFRRRLKGVVLLIVLFLLATYLEPFTAAEWSGAREVLLYFGLCLIVLIWVLILATRDMRETAERALAQGQKLTTDSFEEIQQQIMIRRRDHQRIPAAKEHPPAANKEPKK